MVTGTPRPDPSQSTAVLGSDKAKPLARRPEGPALSEPARGAGRKAGRDGEVVPADEQRDKAITVRYRALVPPAGSAA